MNGENREQLEVQTGALFEGLWGPYDVQLFEESVELFYRRLDRVKFARNWFAGKRCLDAGCGGGRNSIAMARLGASRVEGIDLGAKGIEDARRRAADLSNVGFQQASILDIPFADEEFDLVWCAGVLMITADEHRALAELTRVTKRGGYLYLLVYATEGVRWPLIEVLRPLAETLGRDAMERAIRDSGEPANKRRTFLDDLFCPKLDFYHWVRLERMLSAHGFTRIDRWGPAARLDHEADLASYRADLESLLNIFTAGATQEASAGEGFGRGRDIVRGVVDTVKYYERLVATGELTEEAASHAVIGQGHHRVLATRG
jgi:ubiquinone/menaquinone biosynthesis C-methylase UbiE